MARDKVINMAPAAGGQHLDTLIRQFNTALEGHRCFLREVKDTVIKVMADDSPNTSTTRDSLALHRTVKAAKTPGMMKKQSRQARTNLKGAVAKFILDSPNTTLNDTDDASSSNIIADCMTPNRADAPTMKGKRLRSLLEEHKKSGVRPVKAANTSQLSTRSTRSTAQVPEEQELYVNSTMLVPGTPQTPFSNITIIENDATPRASIASPVTKHRYSSTPVSVAPKSTRFASGEDELIITPISQVTPKVRLFPDNAESTPIQANEEATCTPSPQPRPPCAGQTPFIPKPSVLTLTSSASPAPASVPTPSTRAVSSNVSKLNVTNVADLPTPPKPAQSTTPAPPFKLPVITLGSDHGSDQETDRDEREAENMDCILEESEVEIVDQKEYDMSEEDVFVSLNEEDKENMEELEEVVQEGRSLEAELLEAEKGETEEDDEVEVKEKKYGIADVEERSQDMSIIEPMQVVKEEEEVLEKEAQAGHEDSKESQDLYDDKVEVAEPDQEVSLIKEQVSEQEDEVVDEVKEVVAEVVSEVQVEPEIELVEDSTEEISVEEPAEEPAEEPTVCTEVAGAPAEEDAGEEAILEEEAAEAVPEEEDSSEVVMSSQESLPKVVEEEEETPVVRRTRTASATAEKKAKEKSKSPLINAPAVYSTRSLAKTAVMKVAESGTRSTRSSNKKPDPARELLPRAGTVRKMVEKIESPKKEFTMPSKKKRIPVLDITKTKVAKRDRDTDEDSSLDESVSKKARGNTPNRARNATPRNKAPANLMTSMASFVNRPVEAPVKTAKELEEEKKQTALKKIEEKNAKAAEVMLKKKEKADQLRLVRREKEKRMAKAKLNREEEARQKKEELEKKMKMKDVVAAKEKEALAKKEEEKWLKETRRAEQAAAKRRQEQEAKEQKLANTRKEAQERKEEAIRRKQELEEKRVRDLEKHRAEENARLEEQRKVEVEELNKRQRAEEVNKRQRAEEVNKRQRAEEVNKRQRAEEVRRQKEEEEKKKKERTPTTGIKKKPATQHVGHLLVEQSADTPVRPPRTLKAERVLEEALPPSLPKRPPQVVGSPQRPPQVVDSPASATTNRLAEYMKNKMNKMSSAGMLSIIEDEPTPPKLYYNPADNYNIHDLGTDEDTDDESKPKKAVPNWCKNKKELRAKLVHQFTSKERVKHTDVFAPYPMPDLDELFKTTNKFKSRTSSAHWSKPPMTGELDFSILNEDEIQRAREIKRKYQSNK